MSTFGGIILTNRGKNLQSKAQAGVKLEYSRIGVGDGELGSTSIISLNHLINEVMSLDIIKLRTLGDGKAVVGTVLSNQDMDQGFYFREIGVYANDPDLGEILYCYGNAGDLAEYISPGDGSDIIEKSIDVQMAVGNAENITAIINESLVYASKEDVDKKVDKVEGKGLSTNDYTTAEKEKLEGIEAGANKYEHPKNHSANIIIETTERRFVSDDEKSDWNGKETPAGAQEKATKALSDAKAYTDQSLEMGKYKWQYNESTDSLDLVVIE